MSLQTNRPQGSITVAMERKNSGSATAQVRKVYDRMAARYDRDIAWAEKHLFAHGRQWVSQQARGRVLELAIGTGRNLPYYPNHVEVLGVELSPAMLAYARWRASAVSYPVALCVGDAQQLSIADECIDTVIFTLALCTIPDHQKALREAWRVLRSGGHLILLEHVRSPLLLVRAVQQLLDPFTVALISDHLLRDPLDDLRTLGFEVITCERLRWGIVERVVARKLD
jgi:ubiquinone/menaquinone biosynthesis C-methylase UbiE